MRKSWRIVATIDLKTWKDAVRVLSALGDVEIDERCKSHFELVELNLTDSSEQSITGESK